MGHVERSIGVTMRHDLDDLQRRWLAPSPNTQPPAPTDRERIIVMAYGVNPRLYLENGPAVEAAKARARSSAADYQSVWDALGREQRMALVERQLRTAA
jgi:hypothetical protein